MRQFNTKAIVLRRTNYGESDRIINFITPDHGRVSAIAKGVRKPKSKLAGGLELFAVCDITVAEGRGSLGMVTSARINNFFGDILRQYERTELAYVMIKEISRATESIGEPEFFDLLRDGLASINAGIPLGIVELWFRLKMLTLLGKSLNFASDASGEALQPKTKYNYDFLENAFYVDAGGVFNEAHIKLLRLAAAKEPAVLQQVGGVGEVLDKCLWLVRTTDND